MEVPVDVFTVTTTVVPKYRHHVNQPLSQPTLRINGETQRVLAIRVITQLITR